MVMKTPFRLSCRSVSRVQCDCVYVFDDHATVDAALRPSCRSRAELRDAARAELEEWLAVRVDQ
jgi:hypothetical protein